jgi:hypothetical protein
MMTAASPAAGAASHHAAILHHGFMRRYHPTPRQIAHLGRVLLESLDSRCVGRGLNDNDSPLGRLIGALDLVL